MALIVSNVTLNVSVGAGEEKGRYQRLRSSISLTA
jgi:hypothetical protein